MWSNSCDGAISLRTAAKGTNSCRPSFFHIRSGDKLIMDLEGQEFAGAEDARIDAVEAAREMLVEKTRGGQTVGDESIEIADATGSVTESILLIDQISRRTERPSRRASLSIYAI
jgi:hypothetical protein